MEPMVYLGVREVAHLMHISRVEVYRRMHPGDPHYLISKDRREVDGRRGRLIYLSSLPWPEQRLWRERQLAAIPSPSKSVVGSNVGPALTVPATAAGQLALIQPDALDAKIAALDLPKNQRDVAIRRVRVADLAVNHNWRTEGYKSKREFLNALAAQVSTSRRSVERWAASWKRTRDPRDLVPDRPGPEPGTGEILDSGAKAHLAFLWLTQKLTIRQSYLELKRHLLEKQKSPGCRVSYIYGIPSESSVKRYFHSLDSLSQATRQGPDARREACGYLDRRYDDLAALERVEVDEWKGDFLAYDPAHPRIVRRWWLLTFYDCRSTYPLEWELVAGNEYELRRGISQEDEICLLVRLIREYGIPGAFHSDRGRFRGKVFGGRPLGEILDEKFAEADGILDRLGIAHNMPREKNPRGTRLERFHRFLSDQCRRVPGWIGANTKERETAPGDNQVAEHLLWEDGQRATTPLLSRDEAKIEISKWMEEWRDHPSEGTGMRGLSPRAVFVHATPAGGFRRISDDELALKTARHVPDKVIEAGGIVTVDHRRYSAPALLLISGERREIVAPRDDDSFVLVLAARKGEETVLAERRVPVGANDPANLAAQSEYLARVRKLVRDWAPKGVSDAGYQVSGQDLESRIPSRESRDPSVEAKLEKLATEVETIRQKRDAAEAPSLYDLKPCTAEEM